LSATRPRQLIGLPDGDTIVDYRDRALLKTFIWSGIRLTTGCRLKISDSHQDGDEATLRLHEKGDKRRTIGLHFTAAQAISEYLAKAELTSGPLFLPRLGPRSQKLANRSLEASAMYKLILYYLEQLPDAMKEDQLPDGSTIRHCMYTPHSLRATAPTLLLDGNVDIIKVKDLLGHQHATTTQIYDKRRRSTSESAGHLLAI
jgi:site-specific recombinase XerD